VTSGSAQEKAEEMAEKAVVDHLAPICVVQFLKDPNKEERLKELKEKSSWERADYVKEIGWATMPGAESPDYEVADECARRLMELKE
jgi:predicted DNA-binding protein